MMNLWQKFAIVAAAVIVAACDKDKPLAPVPQPQPPANSAEFVQALAATYQAQDYATYAAMLSDEFLFIFDEPIPDTGETYWDAAIERRIHARMFDPQNIPASDAPLAAALWLQEVRVTLTLQVTFVERPDLYTSFDPPGPLDPVRWIARSGTYGYDVFFQLAGDTDYQARGRLDFAVLEDRTKQVGDTGKFLLYRWEELGNMKTAAVEGGSWTAVKSLFR